jgi:uncharacterized membrane protein
MMLFLTNFLAILLAGGVTFLLGGLGRLATTNENMRMRRNAFILVVVATVLIAIPLSLTTYEVVNRALEDRTAIEEVDAWLAGRTYEIVVVDAQEGTVLVTIDGTGELGSLRDLANQLADALKRPIRVSLHAIPSQVESSGAAAP